MSYTGTTTPLSTSFTSPVYEETGVAARKAAGLAILHAALLRHWQRIEFRSGQNFVTPERFGPTNDAVAKGVHRTHIRGLYYNLQLQHATKVSGLNQLKLHESNVQSLVWLPQQVEDEAGQPINRERYMHTLGCMWGGIGADIGVLDIPWVNTTGRGVGPLLVCPVRCRSVKCGVSRMYARPSRDSECGDGCHHVDGGG